MLKSYLNKIMLPPPPHNIIIRIERKISIVTSITISNDLKNTILTYKNGVATKSLKDKVFFYFHENFQKRIFSKRIFSKTDISKNGYFQKQIFSKRRLLNF